MAKNSHSDRSARGGTTNESRGGAAFGGISSGGFVASPGSNVTLSNVTTTPPLPESLDHFEKLITRLDEVADRMQGAIDRLAAGGPTAGSMAQLSVKPGGGHLGRLAGCVGELSGRISRLETFADRLTQAL